VDVLETQTQIAVLTLGSSRHWTRLRPSRRLDGAVVDPAEPALRMSTAPADAAAKPPAAGASIESRFGEITPAFAAAFGAGVDVGLLLGARNAQARAFATSARSGRRAASGPVLPVEIPTAQALPPSRVCTAIITEPGRWEKTGRRRHVRR
jgi:hypothetical protein